MRIVTGRLVIAPGPWAKPGGSSQGRDDGAAIAANLRKATRTPEGIWETWAGAWIAGAARKQALIGCVSAHP